jgi:hypothetical protein
MFNSYLSNFQKEVPSISPEFMCILFRAMIVMRDDICILPLQSPKKGGKVFG